ncbi:MAG TPA: Rieske (2Fe-2S) protein [Pyrinomonadaceae bacterium]
MKSQQSTEAAGQPASDEQPLRREFCNSLAVVSAWLAVASSGLTSAAAQQNPTLVYPPQKIEGAERLLPGSSLYFTYPTRYEPAILVRAQDGQYYAYSQKCTHRGCSVYFDRGRRCLECPCHQGAFDVKSGDAMYGPPRRPLDQVSLQMRAGGEVWAVGRKSGGREFYA